MYASQNCELDVEPLKSPIENLKNFHVMEPLDLFMPKADDNDCRS